MNPSDSLKALSAIPSASAASCIIDPPYASGTREPTGDELIEYLRASGDFLGSEWGIPSVAFFRECFRVLKPGGYLLSFGGPETFDLISIGIRAAGFECRDTIAQHLGAVERKPSWEPILVYRKPLAEKTIAKQVLATGTGALNIEACRVPMPDRAAYEQMRHNFHWARGRVSKGFNTSPALSPEELIANSAGGRWPANSVFIHLPACKTTPDQIPVYECGQGCPVTLLDKQSGETTSTAYLRHNSANEDTLLWKETARISYGYSDFGGASRFFSQFESESTLNECAEGCPVKILDDQSGVSKSVGGRLTNITGGLFGLGNSGLTAAEAKGDPGYGDIGGASRFFTQFESERPALNEERAYECAEGCPVKTLDRQSGYSPASTGRVVTGIGYGSTAKAVRFVPPMDGGGASRFFGQFDPAARSTNRNQRSLSLLRWLVKLVTPKGGTVLDPYSGDGATCRAAFEEGCGFIGIECNPESL